MSKRYADSELAEISKTLDSDDPEKYPSFETPLPDHLRDNVASLTRLRLFKGIHRLSLTQWMVRVSLNGIQYVVGRTSSPETAMRFADMAQMYFWPYRTRRARPPVNNQLNFSVEQAKTDLKEEDIRKVLFQVEELLATRKVLDPEEGKRARLLADTESLRAAGVPVPESPETTATVRRSLRADHAELAQSTGKSFMEVGTRLTKLEEEDRHNVAIGVKIFDRITELEKQQSQLIAVLADFRNRLLSGRYQPRLRGKNHSAVCTPENVC